MKIIIGNANLAVVKAAIKSGLMDSIGASNNWLAPSYSRDKAAIVVSGGPGFSRYWTVKVVQYGDVTDITSPDGRTYAQAFVHAKVLIPAIAGIE